MSRALELIFKKPDYIAPANTESALIEHLYSSSHLSPRIIACKLGKTEDYIVATLKKSGVVDD